MKKKEPILVRGYRNGLYITVDDSIETEEMGEKIGERIKNLGSFIKGAGVVLELGARTLSDDELRSLQKRFEREYGLRIGQLITASDKTRHAAEILRIRAAPTLLQQRITEGGLDRPREPNTITVPHTLRSGALERYLEGSILVMGDVNPGAEVIASGHVFVLGTLRGVVHAGAMGDQKAIVLALNLQATQLRIADHIARAPEGGRRPNVRVPGVFPEIARIEGDQIVVKDFTGLESVAGGL